MSRAVVNRPCPDAQCAMWGKLSKGNIRLHGFLKLKRARRRRYRCGACGKPGLLRWGDCLLEEVGGLLGSLVL